MVENHNKQLDHFYDAEFHAGKYSENSIVEGSKADVLTTIDTNSYERSRKLSVSRSRCRSISVDCLRTLKHGSRKVIYNWSGIHEIAQQHQIIRPTMVEELADIVRTATSKVTVMGTGLSYEKLMATSLDDTKSIVISMEHFKGLIEMKAQTAVFGAATSVSEIIAILAENNRMLACSPGVIGIQTIAGAIATGTHGQGIFQQAYADTVRSLVVVLPNGSIQNINTDTEADYPIEAFATAMGTLGITTQVEIVHVPRKVFSCRKFTCKLEVFLNDYQHSNELTEYVKVWWFPETDLCHVWLVDEADPKQESDFLTTSRVELLEAKHERKSINETIDKYMAAMALDTKAASESSLPQFQTLRRFANAKDVIGYQEQILCKGIPVPQINCEIAVPLHLAREATIAIKTWATKNQDRLHYPFIYRATGQSSIWLSPAYTGPVCYIGFLVYVAEDGTVRNDGMSTMYEIQNILASFGGLPHWGKHFRPHVYDFPTCLPKWKDFLALRARVDPKKKMLSPFLEEVFGLREQ